MIGHLTRKCRNREEQKKKTVVGNRFEVLRSRIMQCGVREVRRQEKVEEIVKCFACGEKRHKKWECSRKSERKEEVAPPREVWEKVKLHSSAKGLPPRGAEMSMEGWIMRREVVTFVKCCRCNYKGTVRISAAVG